MLSQNTNMPRSSTVYTQCRHSANQCNQQWQTITADDIDYVTLHVFRHQQSTTSKMTEITLYGLVTSSGSVSTRQSTTAEIRAASSSVGRSLHDPKQTPDNHNHSDKYVLLKLFSCWKQKGRRSHQIIT